MEGGWSNARIIVNYTNSYRQMVDPVVVREEGENLQDLCSEEALKYIVGYVGHKMRKKYPGQIDPTAPTIPAQGTWIEAKSRSKLVCPTLNLWDTVTKYSRLFNEFHGKIIYMGPLPIETLVYLIVQEYGLVEQNFL